MSRKRPYTPSVWVGGDRSNRRFLGLAEEKIFCRLSLLSPKVRSSVSFSGLEGSEGHRDSGCEASVVPDYVFVDPQALPLSFSLEAVQQKWRDVFPSYTLVF